MILSIGAIVASLSTIFGLLSGLIPNFLKYLEMKAQHKHEVELLRLQIEAASRGIEMQAIANDRDSARDHDVTISGNGFMEALRASVRPVITYAFFGLFVVVKVSAVVLLFRQGTNPMEILNTIWDAYTMAIFGSVLGFWFGSRSMQRLNESSSDNNETTRVIKKKGS